MYALPVEAGDPLPPPGATPGDPVPGHAAVPELRSGLRAQPELCEPVDPSRATGARGGAGPLPRAARAHRRAARDASAEQPALPDLGAPRAAGRPEPGDQHRGPEAWRGAGTAGPAGR